MQEHPGRASNPVIKVHDLAWLEFEKPDLVKAEAFARAFGFEVAAHTGSELRLRGTDQGSPCALVRPGARSRFTAMAFTAADPRDLHRLAQHTGAAVRPLPDALGGIAVELADPTGLPVRVVAGTHQLGQLRPQEPLPLNFGHDIARINATQRPPRAPARVQRLGHLVLQSTRYRETLDWYLEHLGLIVSDFLFFPGQRERGPAMSFIRCDRGMAPTDHHTLALALGPANRYVHSAFQVCDLDALAAGGQHLQDRGYQRSWGIGRHVQGSQLFDYWRDPDGLLVEHFTDGDLFDCTAAPEWAPFTASGLSQWGPPVTRNFLGTDPKSIPGEARSMLSALRSDNEFDLNRLFGLMKVAQS